jgi:hypothetical protein
MHRSGEYGLAHLQSSTNDSWEKPLSPCLSPNDMSISSTKTSICVDHLLVDLRRDHRKLLDESNKREKRPMSQKRLLVDAVKMDQLLQLLRTNEFIGTIDPKHHSYLSEQLLQESAKKCTVNKLMPRRSSAYSPRKGNPLISSRRSRKSSHLQLLLRKV